MRNLPEWAPGSGFLRKARVWRTEMEEFVDKPYEFVKESMVRRRPRILVVLFLKLVWLAA